MASMKVEWTWRHGARLVQAFCPGLCVALILPCVAATASRLAGIEPLQFASDGHVSGFQPTGVYVAGGDHLLKVESVGVPGVVPVSSQEREEDGGPSPLGEVTYPDLWPGVSVTYQQPMGGIVKST